MSLDIKFVPLTFIKSNEEILKQIKNTVCFSFLFNQFEETTLSHYIESTQYGYTASANTAGSHRLLRITDINNGDVNWNNVPFCNCDSEDKYLLKDNDILIARTGGTTGKSFIALGVPSNAIFASYLIRLRLKKGVNIDFINVFLNSYIFWSQIIEMKSGSAMPNVNAEKLKLLKIPKCDIETQEKVAINIKSRSGIIEDEYLKKQVTLVEDVFNKGNNITSELSHQLDLVKKLRQQLLHDAIQGKLVDQNPNDEQASILLQKIKAEKEQLIKDKKLKKEKALPEIKEEEMPFEIPDNWVWCRLGQVCQKIHYGLNASAKPNKKDVRLLRITDIQNNKVDWDSVPGCDFVKSDLENYLLSKNDLVIARTGGTIGKTFLVKELSVKSLFASYLIRAIPSKNISPEYLKAFLESPFYWNQLYNAAWGAQLNVNGTSLSNLVLPLPPIKEQDQIILKLEQLLQTCDALEASIKQSQQQNEQLLQQVLREALTKEVTTETNEKEKYKSLLLAAEIIWQLNQKPTLGHIKLQKLIYLGNRSLQMNLPVNFLKRAMGPYDQELQEYIDKELAARQWFSYNEDEPLKYRPLKNAGSHKADFDKYFGEHAAGINHLVHLFEDARSATLEIVATLYWCWDEMLTDKQLVNDTALLAKFYAFSDKKKKHTQDNVIKALRWMEVQGIVSS